MLRTCGEIVKSALAPYPTWVCDLPTDHECNHRSNADDVEWPRDLAGEAFVVAIAESFAAVPVSVLGADTREAEK